jgi:hypothetical protein
MAQASSRAKGREQLMMEERFDKADPNATSSNGDHPLD